MNCQWRVVIARVAVYQGQGIRGAIVEGIYYYARAYGTGGEVG